MLMCLNSKDASLTLRHGSARCWAMVLTRKGYHLYDLERMKVIHCRDVVFNEASMPGIQKENETTVKYVELDIEEDSIFKETMTPDSADTAREESTASNSIVSESSLRRTARNRQQPDRYSLTLVSTEQQDPSSVAEAKSIPDKAKWKKAIETEMESLHSSEVWELVEPPPNRNIVGSKWIFK